MSLVENLSRDYGDFQLQVPRWEIPDQGITALWGPSGSGKTTLFRILLGLEPCEGWSWHFNGQDLAQLSVPARRLGVVFQGLELFPHLTAAENIRFAAQARQRDPAESERDLQGLAQELQITALLDKNVTLLSGGERQRVALARAIIGQPRMLLLDEPFSSLDADSRTEARALLKRVVQAHRISALLITHDQEDLRVLANSAVEIRAGRIVGQRDLSQS
ncbi:MAG: ATP-binding cassette domain-containing protein [Bdellovibrionales bacterium]